jgi:hypothetical protein
MKFSVEVPDSFAKPLHLDGPHPDRRVLEALALDGYRSGELSRGQVGEVLGLSLHETEQFLHDHNAPGLTPEQNLEGVRNLERLLSR